MAFGNSPNNASTSTTSTTSTSNSQGVGNDVFGNAISGNTGTVNTSDFGAIKAASDIALSGLQSSLAESTKAADTVQTALNKVTALGSQTASGGLTTVLVPALWVLGGLGAIYFLTRHKKGS